MRNLKKYAWIGATATALVGAAALAQMHALPAPPKASFSAERQPVPFELFRGQRMVLKGTVNGVHTDMLLDSGAGMTVIDRAFAERIGIKPGASIQVQGAAGAVPGAIASDVSLNAGQLRLTGLNALILDMSDVARAIGRPIPVVLGREAFRAGAVTIDFPRRTIRFADRAGLIAPPGAVRLDVTERGRTPRVEVAVAGLAPIQADLDIGNGGTIVLARDYWAAQPALASLRHAESQSGGVGGIKIARRVTLPSVEFAGRRFADVPATLNEDSRSLPTHGGNIGIELLKAFVVTLDMADGVLYLQPGGEAPKFERERAGVRTELAGDRLKVAYVSPDGPAAGAGLKVGDEIVAIDGSRIDAHYYDQPEWTRGAAGGSVSLERADGSRVAIILRDYY